jgi:hypothetical protein
VHDRRYSRQTACSIDCLLLPMPRRSAKVMVLTQMTVVVVEVVRVEKWTAMKRNNVVMTMTTRVVKMACQLAELSTMEHWYRW